VHVHRIGYERRTDNLEENCTAGHSYSTVWELCTEHWEDKLHTSAYAPQHVHQFWIMGRQIALQCVCTEVCITILDIGKTTAHQCVCTLVRITIMDNGMTSRMPVRIHHSKYNKLTLGRQTDRSEYNNHGQWEDKSYISAYAP
jgi:hypothetical protein